MYNEKIHKFPGKKNKKIKITIKVYQKKKKRNFLPYLRVDANIRRVFF